MAGKCNGDSTLNHLNGPHQRIMERDAGEIKMERIREGADAVQAVAAEFELKAVEQQGG